MLRFHFHLVAGNEREHVGTLDLPEHDSSVTGGIYLTMKVLVDIILADNADGDLTLQATGETGAVIRDLHVPQCPHGNVKSKSYLH